MPSAPIIRAFVLATPPFHIDAAARERRVTLTERGRVLPGASNLWVQSSLNPKQLLFSEAVRFDRNRLVGTGLTLRFSTT
jgi:hypothetical protein